MQVVIVRHFLYLVHGYVLPLYEGGDHGIHLILAPYTLHLPRVQYTGHSRIQISMTC
jgi:hypothetical protein